MTRKVISRRITESAIQDARKNEVSEIRDTLIMGFSCMFSRDQTVISFFYRYRSKLEQKRPVVKVGRWPSVSADIAREVVTGWVADIAKGKEPHIERERQRQEIKERQKHQVTFMTLAEFWDGHYREHLLRNKSGSGDLDRLKRDFSTWRDRSLRELKKLDLVAWQIACEKRGLAHSSIKRSWNVLRAMLNYAVEMEVIDRNPLQGARLQRPGAVESEGLPIPVRRRVLHQKEVDGLFRGLQLYTDERKQQRRHSRRKASKQYLPDLDKKTYADHVVPFMLCIYYGGFRPGDIFSLRWEHLENDFTLITKVLDKTAHHGNKVQYFPLSESLTRVLKLWWEDQGLPRKGYVFSSPRFAQGERMLASSAMRKPWLKIKKFGGLPTELDIYSLRHNFASQLVMAGVDLPTVKSLMGHASIETTVKHYAHLRQDHLQEALRRLETERS
ncbi:tyrosine-type recombinase/integrase [Halomonas sp. QHL1]|uniref:tyrosine-type recombinase/integrase n=1 Tax=Halomonas sp. QHL1 TaxID=1123773 RepID=UPI0008FD3C63|nr:tyrosine-type recombinase/integrase [Halomonas sp. QHL1]OJA06431.1 hypothetical protein QHL1GM_14100 [Halomonas sp. QHL1]